MTGLINKPSINQIFILSCSMLLEVLCHQLVLNAIWLENTTKYLPT